MNLNDYSKLCHAANQKWWQNIDTGEPIKRNKGELLALMHSEISECYDGECEHAMDDKLVHRYQGEVELVDFQIRAFDYAAGFGHDLNRAGLLIGVSEFQNLRHLGECAMIAQSDREKLLGKVSSIAFIHSLTSRILENERKGRTRDAENALAYVIACVSLCGVYRDYDLQGAFVEKMEFNRTREDHRHESRKIAGGKQF
jgi:hypothetical protein